MVTYSFAIINAVPHVHKGQRIPVGVILHARTSGLLRLKVIESPDILRGRLATAATVSGISDHPVDTGITGAVSCDVDLLFRYLQSCKAIAEGNTLAGPIALSPHSERFHWLTALRSDVIQPSVVHEGVSTDPEGEVDRLYGIYVS